MIVETFDNIISCGSLNDLDHFSLIFKKVALAFVLQSNILLRHFGGLGQHTELSFRLR